MMSSRSWKLDLVVGGGEGGYPLSLFFLERLADFLVHLSEGVTFGGGVIAFSFFC